MKPLLTLLLLLAFLRVLPQENTHSGAQSMEDSVKAMSMLQQGASVSTTDMAKAKQLSQEGLRMGLAIPNDFIVTRSYQVLAFYERRLRNQQLLLYDSLFLTYATKNKNQALVLNALDLYAQDLLNQEFYERAKLKITDGTRLAAEAGDKNAMGRFYHNWGFYYYRSNRLPEATKYYEKSLVIFTELKNETMQAYSKQWLANISIYSGVVNNTMLDYLYEAINYYNGKNNRLSDQATCYDILGYAFQSTGNIGKATGYYLQSRELFDKAGYTIKVIDEDLALGEIYIEKKNTDSSSFYLNEAEKLSIDAGYTRGTVIAKTLRIKLLTAQKKYAEAEKMADTAKNFNARASRKEIDLLINEYLAKTKEGRGEIDSSVYYSLKKIAIIKASYPPAVLSQIIDARLKSLSLKDQDAINGLKKLWDLADTSNADKQLMRDLTGKEYAAVMNTIARLDMVYDSSLGRAAQQQLLEAETRYKTRQVKDSLTIQQQQNIIQTQKITSRNWWLLIAGILSLAAVLFTILQFKYRKKAEADKKTIERYQQELLHRDDNQFAQINSLIEITKETSTDAGSFTILTGRIKALNKIRTLIYQNGDAKEVDLHDYLASLCTNYNMIYEPGKIMLQQEDAILLPVKKAEKLGLIVHEIITNAFKHAFTDPATAMVNIHLSAASSGGYRVHIADNGKGIVNPGNDRSGMEIITGLTEEIDGTLKKYNQEGAHFEIFFM